MVGFGMAKTIYVLNGPNLDLLGTREPEANGHAALSDVEKLCVETAERYGLGTDCRRCSREDELIELIHEAEAKNAAGIVINVGGYSHSSIALHGALAAVKIPAIEVHVSNAGAGDNFRHHSFAAQATFASLCGFGFDGFRLAISGLAAKIGAQAAA
jgi:3-dehydroquinate dehydratase-2